MKVQFKFIHFLMFLNVLLDVTILVNNPKRLQKIILKKMEVLEQTVYFIMCICRFLLHWKEKTQNLFSFCLTCFVLPFMIVLFVLHI